MSDNSHGKQCAKCRKWNGGKLDVNFSPFCGKLHSKWNIFEVLKRKLGQKQIVPLQPESRERQKKSPSPSSHLPGISVTRFCFDMMSVSQQKRHKTELKLSCNEMCHHTVTKHDDSQHFYIFSAHNKVQGVAPFFRKHTHWTDCWWPAIAIAWPDLDGRSKFWRKISSSGENLYAVNVKSCGMAHILSARTE